MDSEQRAWIFLNRIPELGPARFHRLLHAAQSAQGILDLSIAGLQAAEVSQEIAELWFRAFRDPVNLRWLDAEEAHLSKGDCHVVTELDEGYPGLLRELYGRPPVLYYKGRWPLPVAGVVGLVGTRRLTGYGKSVAERMATDLTVQGMTTVSGLAEGIDTCIHQATLQAKGATVAVLGCGLGQVFPRQNAALQQRIAEAGTLVSEFPYDAPPATGQFPQRNRIISGLSQGVVVIEAGERSGALITAHCAVEQGRDVFAVPGSVYSPMSAGCHRLIKEGAKLVTNAIDILEDLGVSQRNTPTAPPPLMSSFSPKRAVFATLTPLEKQIVQLLASEPLSADELSLGTSQRVEQLSNSLLSLELKGIIRALPGQRYACK